MLRDLPLPVWTSGRILSANAQCPNVDINHPTGRVNPYWQSITLQCSCANSWYNSLQVLVTKQLSKGLQFQGNYTFSKNLDEGSGQQSADNSTSGIDPQFPRSDLGPAVFDVTHNFRFNALYHMPHFTDQRLLGGVVNGWWMSTIISLQSGYPFTATTGNQSYSANSGDYPDLAPGRSVYSVTHGFSTANGIDACPTAGERLGTFGSNGLYFDPCAFILQQPGTLSDVSRDLFRGPGTNDVNFSVVKDTPVRYLGEGGQIEFRAEIFNLFNHPNFSLPAAGVYTGSVTTTDYDNRNRGPAVWVANSDDRARVQSLLRRQAPRVRCNLR